MHFSQLRISVTTRRTPATVGVQWLKWVTNSADIIILWSVIIKKYRGTDKVYYWTSSTPDKRLKRCCSKHPLKITGHDWASCSCRHVSLVNRMWWDLLHNTAFCTEVWFPVSGGMFLLIADIISYQLVIYWVIIALPAKLNKYVKAGYQLIFIIRFYVYWS